MKKINWLVFIPLVIITGCNQLSEYSTDEKLYTTQKEEEGIICLPENTIPGVGNRGQLKITGVLNELHIMHDGFKIVPHTGLGSWAAFTSHPDSAMVIGDIIIPETDFTSVQQEVVAQGLTITDIHKYPAARYGPIILFMHINGFGNNSTLLRNVNALFAKLEGIGDKNPKEGKANNVITNLNSAKLDSIIGYQGEVAGDVYKYNMGRLEVSRAHGNASLEFNTWAAWQGTDKRAVVAGKFTMQKNEVGPIIKALAENGFQLVHNHLVHEDPDIFTLHYWGDGNAERLAKGLKAALDQQAKK